VWVTFLLVCLLYAVGAVVTIRVLRGMSRRFRRSGGFVEHDAPYGPSTPLDRAATEEKDPVP
jgi:cytochrome d ubiquinol oxidase subunit I